MYQDAVPTWGHGPAIGQQAETVGSLIWLASRRRSLSGSTLVSVDCLCVAQGCVAGRRGNAREAKKYNVTLLTVPNLFKIGSTFLPVFSVDYTNIFFAPWSLASFNFFPWEKLILTESLLVIERASERTRDVRHCSRTPGMISFPQILKWWLTF